MASKSKFTKIPYQVQRDINLLNFDNYDDYVDSFVKTKDLEYLSGIFVARQIMKEGQGSSGTVLSYKEFVERSKAARKYLQPNRKEKSLQSFGITEFCDPLLEALAKRESKNLAGIVATVIFLRDFNDLDHEISAFIDFRYRLCIQNWKEIFAGEKKLKPMTLDLSFYNWKNHEVYTNDSPNFEVKTGESAGTLYILCRHDERKFKIDTECRYAHMLREEIPTKMFLQAVVYDHVITKMIDLRKQKI